MWRRTWWKFGGCKCERGGENKNAGRMGRGFGSTNGSGQRYARCQISSCCRTQIFWTNSATQHTQGNVLIRLTNLYCWHFTHLGHSALHIWITVICFKHWDWESPSLEHLLLAFTDVILQKRYLCIDRSLALNIKQKSMFFLSLSYCKPLSYLCLPVDYIVASFMVSLLCRRRKANWASSIRRMLCWNVRSIFCKPGYRKRLMWISNRLNKLRPSSQSYRYTVQYVQENIIKRVAMWSYAKWMRSLATQRFWARSILLKTLKLVDCLPLRGLLAYWESSAIRTLESGAPSLHPPLLIQNANYVARNTEVCK